MKFNRGNCRDWNVQVRVPRDYPWYVLGTLGKGLSEHLSSDESLLICRIIRDRDWSAYYQLDGIWGLQSIPPDASGSVMHSHRAKYLLSAVIRKYCDDVSELRKEKALAAVLAGEESCSKFNRTHRKELEIKLPAVLEYARVFIARIVGDILPETEQLLFGARHGPGSSANCGYKACSKYDKYQSWPYPVTPGCTQYAREMISADPRWFGVLEESYRDRFGIPRWAILDWTTFWSSVLKIVPGNKITTVPKDGQKDRPIAIEPDMNMMLQLGVDDYVRRRLRRYGLDLDNQAEVNQKLAWEGSLGTGLLNPATIDLSNASDCVSLGLVKILLPEPWYRYLCALRSPSGELPSGKRLRYSKLSSMGNGYTFAIETLLFYAISYGCCMEYFGYFPQEKVSTFGDDIIVPEAVAPRVVSVLEYVGFSTNRSKTFLAGSVKESCGTDYVRGFNVRPVYLKKKPESVLDLFSDRNRLKRYAELAGFTQLGYSIDEYFAPLIPSQFRNCRGPISDDVFDCWWHTASKTRLLGNEFPWQRGFDALRPRAAKQRKLVEFGFRKLMHDLKSCTAESGGRFDAFEAQNSVTFARISRRSCPPQGWQTEYSWKAPHGSELHPLVSVI
jgi:hypothetical protein